MRRKKGFYPTGTIVRKTVSLPADLARRAETLARAEGKSLSGVIWDALQPGSIGRRLQELQKLQNFWKRKARSKDIFTERGLTRHLRDR